MRLRTALQGTDRLYTVNGTPCNGLPVTRGPSVLIDNVADYFFTGTPQELWEAHDFPNCAPPWPEFWCEWTMPSRSLSDGRWVTPSLAKQPRCARVTAIDLSDTPGVATVLAKMATAHTKDWPEGPTPQEAIETARWALRVADFMWDGKRPRLVHELYYFVSTDGSLVCNGAGAPVMLGWSPVERPGWVALDGPIFLALSFLNCRNVVVAEDSTLATPRRRKGPAARRADPSWRYLTLDIRAMRTVLTAATPRDGGTLQKALHICRGHFAHYGDAFGTAKLFGKLEGQFWIPQHVRGGAEQGVIVKDYRVSA